jgi:hypothetical protein
MINLFPSIFVLGLAALVAVLLMQNRHSPPGKAAERIIAAKALLIATVVQGIHFGEEAATGFHERFPGLFDLPAISFPLFLAFNLVWLGIWLASVPGLRSARPIAFFAAWFLAIAGLLNGFAHPLMAISEEEYFPGLVSSPFLFGASVWLWTRLRNASLPGSTAHIDS